MCKNNLAKVDLHLHHLGTKMLSSLSYQGIQKNGEGTFAGEGMP